MASQVEPGKYYLALDGPEMEPYSEYEMIVGLFLDGSKLGAHKLLGFSVEQHRPLVLNVMRRTLICDLMPNYNALLRSILSDLDILHLGR